MKIGLLIAVIIYFIVSISIVSLIIHRRERAMNQERDFVNAGRSLGPILAGCSMALMFLGGATIFGLCENTWYMGTPALWFGTAMVALITVICMITAPWFRRVGVSTVTDIFDRLFEKRGKVIVAAVTCILQVGILSLETQSVAVTINLLTGWPYFLGAVIGGIIGIFYVILAGMKEIAWMNILNAIVMYAAVIIAVIALGRIMAGGWDGVAQWYAAHPEAGNVSLFTDLSYIWTYFIPVALAVISFHSISQAGLSSALSCKSTKSLKKALIVAVPINGLFGVFTLCMGLAAKAHMDIDIAFLATPQLIVQMLPNWIIGLLAAGFLGALLSTFSLLDLGASTLITKDIIFMGRTDVTEKQQTRIIRLFIVLFGGVAVCVSTFQPAVISAINWIFSWGAPLFVMIVIGLFWKRVKAAMWATFIVAWVVNCLWTMTPLPNVVGLPNLSNVYITLLVSVIVGVIATAVGKGEIGLFKGDLKDVHVE